METELLQFDLIVVCFIGDYWSLLHSVSTRCVLSRYSKGDRFGTCKKQCFILVIFRQSYCKIGQFEVFFKRKRKSKKYNRASSRVILFTNKNNTVTRRGKSFCRKKSDFQPIIVPIYFNPLVTLRVPD